MTGIPVAKLVAGEREKLLHLADHLHERVVGQDAAVDAVSMPYYVRGPVCKILIVR